MKNTPKVACCLFCTVVACSVMFNLFLASSVLAEEKSATAGEKVVLKVGHYVPADDQIVFNVVKLPSIFEYPAKGPVVRMVVFEDILIMIDPMFLACEVKGHEDLVPCFTFMWSVVGGELKDKRLLPTLIVKNAIEAISKNVDLQAPTSKGVDEKELLELIWVQEVLKAFRKDTPSGKPSLEIMRKAGPYCITSGKGLKIGMDCFEKGGKEPLNVQEKPPKKPPAD